MTFSGLAILGCVEMVERVKNVTEGMTQMIGGHDLPDPIADSIERMPRAPKLVGLYQVSGME